MHNNKNGAQAEIGNQLHMIHSHSCDPFGFADLVHIIEVSRPRTLHCVVCVTYAHAPSAGKPISTLREHQREWLCENWFKRSSSLVWNGAKICGFCLFCTGHCIVSVSALLCLASKGGPGFSCVISLLTVLQETFWCQITPSDVVLLEGSGLFGCWRALETDGDEPRRSSFHSNLLLAHTFSVLILQLLSLIY